jgi:sarcosine oxidase, subunit gamma
MSERRAADLVSFSGLQTVPALARFNLRGDLGSLANALSSANVPISRTACRAVEGELCAALWLGPDEQLLLAPDQHSAQLAQVLQASLANIPHSLVDVSHRQTAFEVTGPNARLLLNAGCPLDLRDAAFPLGMCTRTLFEKSEIVLWRTAPDTFHIEVWRSFAPYVTGLLAEVARERA